MPRNPRPAGITVEVVRSTEVLDFAAWASDYVRWLREQRRLAGLDERRSEAA